MNFTINKKIAVYNQRCLQLFFYCIENSIYGTTAEAAEALGFQRTYIYAINKDKASFTTQQIATLLQITGANANWVFGNSNKMFINEKDKDTITLIQEFLKTIK